jgi:pimeloyl-ACP methyl ester carboxylesterase
VARFGVTLVTASIIVERMLRAYGSGSIFGESSGVEPHSVLLLHGWGHDHHDFAPLLQLEGPNCGLLAIDLPGFGASPVPDVACGSDGYARTLAPVLEEMSDRFVIVGHSFGGRVALQMAAIYPDRIAGLVLAGVPLLRPTQGVGVSGRYRLLRRLARLHLLSDQRLESARRRYGSTDYRNAEGVMREVLVMTINEDYRGLISTVSVPVEMVWGEFDSAQPLALAREAAALFPNANLSVIEGGGHMSPLERPEELKDALGRVHR